MSGNAGRPLLSKKSYDDDAASIGSLADVSDAEREHDYEQPDSADRRLLDETEQEERILDTANQRDGLFARALRQSDRKIRAEPYIQRGRQLKEQTEGSGSAEVMYEMESGYKDTSSRSSSESTALEREKWNTGTVRRPYLKFAAIATLILVAFALLAAGAFKLSQKSGPTHKFSNGTHTFGPTTILISLDGFRADFLQRELTPGMNAIIASGVSSKYMLPSFPSLTFPNHFTLVTGLYPESHGIVSNQFWDPNVEEEFYYTNISNSMQPKWWNAEPLWVTAEKQGLRTAIHMWPGSEAHISNMDPTYLDKYNGSEALDIKVNRILGWLDMPETERPQFIGAYVPNVDADGHRYGPNSTEIRKTIVEVDSMLVSLMEGLLARNLTEVVNLVIVSDHGMATTSTDRLYQLDDFIDMSLVDHMDGWPLRGLRLKNPDRDVPILHQQLLEASKDKAFEVYTLDTMPDRYHFSHNARIAPLWVVPNAGWVVIEKADFHILEARESGVSYYPIGLHGYDHEHPLMRAIFIARGPAFPHAPNSRITPFQNIELYNIVCDSLEIQPHSNNGTIRLPFKTEGLHSDFDESVEVLPDFEEAPKGTISTIPSAAASSSAPASSTTGQASKTASATPKGTTSVAAAVATDGPSEAKNHHDIGQSNDEPKKSWLKFLHDKVKEAKEWAKQFIDSFHKSNNQSGSM